MEQAGVPEADQLFEEKWKIAPKLLDELAPEVGAEAVVCDAGYGEVKEFLRELDGRGHLFVAQIPEHHSFWPAQIALTTAANPMGRPRRFPQVADPEAQPLWARQWREQIEREGRKWQKVCLPLKMSKTVEVMAVRVLEINPKAWQRPRAERWLLIEQLTLLNLPPLMRPLNHLSHAGLPSGIRHVVFHRPIADQQLKEELGLDHYEGTVVARLASSDILLHGLLLSAHGKEGQKKSVDVAAGEAVAESDSELDAMSGMSQLSSRPESGVVRLNLSYLT
jgi:hypothetical protein